MRWEKNTGEHERQGHQQMVAQHQYRKQGFGACDDQAPLYFIATTILTRQPSSQNINATQNSSGNISTRLPTSDGSFCTDHHLQNQIRSKLDRGLSNRKKKAVVYINFEDKLSETSTITLPRLERWTMPGPTTRFSQPSHSPAFLLWRARGQWPQKKSQFILPQQA